MQPYCIGLTGGIGSGKSRAADMFADLGADVVDTDEISRKMTARNGSAMPDIIAAFGREAAAADGSLDRAAMRQRIFGDPLTRQKLEGILHPRIREAARHHVAESTAPYVLLVVPLLLETGAYRDLIRRVVVVDCDEALQVSRTIARSHLDEASVQAIMAAQMPRNEKLACADDIIRNDGKVEDLRAQVVMLHAKYLELAAQEARSNPQNRH
ncbi:MAG: dephospho-CoA kinase [Burkholderiales bacterium]|nr:dephospho-CoA kinase [Burkholderiales bacterium]